MRKITKESSEAFVNFQDYFKSNTRVSIIKQFEQGRPENECAYFYLHGNLIARMTKQIGSRYPEGLESIEIDLCGWHTPTTRERINGILEALGYDFRIAQRNHEQVLVRQMNPLPQAFLDQFKLRNAVEGAKEKVLKLSDDSFDPEFAKKVFLSREFVSGTDLNAITDF